MKTKEELNTLRNEIDVLNKKLAELSEEELAQVTGGIGYRIPNNYDCSGIVSTLQGDFIGNHALGAEKQEPGGKNR